jgi:hypothetical protein
MNLPLTITLTLALCGQAPPVEESKEERAARLDDLEGQGRLGRPPEGQGRSWRSLLQPGVANPGVTR